MFNVYYSVNVRSGAMNEDVFLAPAFTDEKIMDSDIQEITEQIHRLLLQVHHFSRNTKKIRYLP